MNCRNNTKLKTKICILYIGILRCLLRGGANARYKYFSASQGLCNEQATIEHGARIDWAVVPILFYWLCGSIPEQALDTQLWGDVLCACCA